MRRLLLAAPIRRAAHTDYKFATKYSDYLKKWELENDQQGRFLEQDQEIDPDRQLTSVEMSKIFSSGKTLPRSYINSDIYQTSLFEEKIYDNLEKAADELRKAAELDFYTEKDMKFTVAYKLPARKEAKSSKGFVTQNAFIDFPHKFNHPPNQILAIVESPDLKAALAGIGVESYSLESTKVSGVMLSPTDEYNIIVADRVYQKALNRETKYMQRFGFRFPKSQNKMMSGSLPTDEWVEFLKDTRDNCYETIVSSNTHSCQIGDGYMDNHELTENLRVLLTHMKGKYREVVDFTLSCCEDTYKFSFDMDSIQIDESARARQGRSKKLKKQK